MKSQIIATRAAVTVILLIAVVAVAPNVAVGQGSRCLGPDSVSTRLVNSIQRIVTQSDTLQRHRLSLSSAPSDSVLLITAPSVCASALNAYDSVATNHVTNRTGYVVRVESRYIVVDYNSRNGGEWVTGLAMDLAFAVLSAFGI